jgi:hypothetical protein
VSQVSQPNRGTQCRHNRDQTDDLPSSGCQRGVSGGFDRQLVSNSLLSFRHMQDSFGGAFNNVLVFPQVARGRQWTDEFLDTNRGGTGDFGGLGRSASSLWRKSRERRER